MNEAVAFFVGWTIAPAIPFWFGPVFFLAAVCFWAPGAFRAWLDKGREPAARARLSARLDEEARKRERERVACKLEQEVRRLADDAAYEIRHGHRALQVLQVARSYEAEHGHLPHWHHG